MKSIDRIQLVKFMRYHAPSLSLSDGIKIMQALIKADLVMIEQDAKVTYPKLENK